MISVPMCINKWLQKAARVSSTKHFLTCGYYQRVRNLLQTLQSFHTSSLLPTHTLFPATPFLSSDLVFFFSFLFQMVDLPIIGLFTMWIKSLSQFPLNNTEHRLYLAEQKISDVENHTEGELGGEEGEEPLGGIHVSLQVQLLEVGPQVRKLFLGEQNVKQRKDEKTGGQN